MKRMFWPMILALWTCLPLLAFGGRDKVEYAQLQPVKVVGQIGIYGNEPHTWLGFVGQNGVEYALDATPQMLEELRSQQGILLELSGLLDSATENRPAGLQILSGGRIQVEKYTIYME